MRRRPGRLDSPFVYAAVGASALAVPAAAAAAASSSNRGGPGSTITAHAKRHRVGYKRRVVVVGHAPSSDRGQTVTLQFSDTRSGSWRQIATGRIRSDGRFRLIAWLRNSGWLKAVTASPAATAAGLPVGAPAQPGVSSSTPERVAVAAAIRVHRSAINDLGGQAVSVRGKLMPGRTRRRIVLEGERSGHWVDLAAARTNSRGEFKLRYRPTGPGQEPLRVRFAGDHTNSAVSGGAGILTVYRQTVASWYYDGGYTACGFHAYYGVANVNLPCGTKVSLMYAGRTVQAVVDDRGPYVGGRTWDLNQNTAAALGFGGVAPVWSSR